MLVFAGSKIKVNELTDGTVGDDGSWDEKLAKRSVYVLISSLFMRMLCKSSGE